MGIEGTESVATAARRRLRELMDQPVPVVAPGVFDGLSARLAAKAGLAVLHASGGAIARSIGYPDLGIVTATEMLARIEEICEAGLPVIADADTGYGGLLNVARTIEIFERAGVAGLHIEDQTFPKRCGLMQGVQVVPYEEARARIVAAAAARRDPGMLIFARTDAVHAEGMEAACARIRGYLEAGADVAFIEGLDDVAAIREAARLVPGPKMINISKAREGLPLPLTELRALGYVVTIFPGDAQSAAIAGMNAVFETLRETGSTKDAAGKLTTSSIRDEAVGTTAAFAREAEWANAR